MPKVYWLTDDFGDPAVDFGRWHLSADGTGIRVVEQNGALELSVGPDAVTDGVYGVDQHYGTNCRLTGDFDARIAFKLLAWPGANGVDVTFAAWVPPPNQSYAAISRVGGTATGGLEAYSAIGSVQGFAQTADMVGALRLTRANGVLTTYFRSGRSWVRLAGGYVRGPAVLIAGLYTKADRFGRQTAHAAFDDFEATAESVDCRGGPLPPRKPRR